MTNARSIPNKVYALNSIVEIADPDIIFITASWLSEDFKNSLLGLQITPSSIETERHGKVGY